MAKARLDMGHGFMQCIIKNQVDRDNYDREVKAKATQVQRAPVRPGQINGRQKKPAIQTYQPPLRKQENGTRPYIFTLEFEDQHGNTHNLDVHEGDNVSVLARKFAHDRSLNQPMTQALMELLQQELNKRSSSSNHAS